MFSRLLLSGEGVLLRILVIAEEGEMDLGLGRTKKGGQGEVVIWLDTFVNIHDIQPPLPM